MAGSQETYVHPAYQVTIFPALKSQISALPLVRRLQFHLQTKHATVIATFPPSSPTLPEQYAIAYIDRSRAPETECWLHSSAEVPDSKDDLILARRQLVSLLEHIRNLPLPESYPSDQGSELLLVGAVHRTTLSLLKNERISDEDGQKVISGDRGSTVIDDTASSHAQVSAKQEEVTEGSHTHGSRAKGNPGEQGVVRGHTIPYAKFIFPPVNLDPDESEAVTSGTKGLPQGMRWSKIQPAEFKLVISRTEIPRKERTLALLPGVGIRLEDGDVDSETQNGRLIAWAFLGVDLSLTSLHVESDFRVRGLAKVLTKRVFALLKPRLEAESHMATVAEPTLLEDPRKGFVGIHDGENYAHSDVARDNMASIGVAKSLGGIDSWECFWAWVDLKAVAEVMNSRGSRA